MFSLITDIEKSNKHIACRRAHHNASRDKTGTCSVTLGMTKANQALNPLSIAIIKVTPCVAWQIVF